MAEEKKYTRIRVRNGGRKGDMRFLACVNTMGKHLSSACSISHTSWSLKHKHLQYRQKCLSRQPFKIHNAQHLKFNQKVSFFLNDTFEPYFQTLWTTLNNLENKEHIKYVDRKNNAGIIFAKHKYNRHHHVLWKKRHVG